MAWQTGEELLVVVGGGAAGVYGAIRAKAVAPRLNVLVIEKGRLLSKVGFYLLFGDIVIMWSFAVVRLPRTEEELDATTEKRGLLMVWDWELEC